MHSTGKSMTLNSYYSCCGTVAAMPAPGFAVSSAVQSDHRSAVSSPAISVSSASNPPGSNSANFSKASSSYKSHFGDSSTGTVPLHSACATTDQKVISHGCSGGVPSRISLSGSAGVLAASFEFVGSPVSAPGSGVIGAGTDLHRNSSSTGNSSQTVSNTSVDKFTSPPSVVTAAWPTPDSAASGAACSGVAASEPVEPTYVTRSVHDVGVLLREFYSGSSSSSSTSSVSSSLAQYGAHTSCLASYFTSPHLSKAGENCSSNPSATTPPAARTVDESALSETHRSTLISFSGNKANVGDGETRSPKVPSCGGPSTFCDSALSAKENSRADDAVVVLPKSPLQRLKQRQQRIGAAPRHPHANSCNYDPSADQLGPDSLPKSRNNSAGQETHVSVYDSDFEALLSIPASQVLHRPSSSLGVSRLVLCRKFTLENPTSCSKGDLCKFVHADIRKVSRCSIHVNYAWRNLSLCTYPRLPAGDEVTVLAPNERPPSEVISSERILVTRGSTNWREHTAPLSHCAHYYFNRMCNRGKRCNFIHAVHVDPNVQGDFKHAPAPRAVAPVVSKPPGSTALRAASGAQAVASEGHQSSAYHGGAVRRSPAAKQPPLLPPVLPSVANNVATAGGGIAYSFTPTIFAPPPHGCMTYPLLSPTLSPPTAMGVPQSPTSVGGGAPYVMLMNSAGQQVGCSYVPATLMTPTSQQLGSTNGVFFIVPTATGAGGSLTGSGAPINWPLYGDLDTTVWMPPSPSSQL
ncbi:conserved hypothetical protein [Leishmania braziliensis MHOM/BR/75/M2904]|uniref:C3H1-type domain-containing protein n=2 Tax=Leishmania braziliensis TaxID=5660 RepID=A4H9L3_LEIBR|nr:conserved hypothetical protein [Leishmania braziliensis MHOM/BR/75/M2904]CAJ2470462.1 unnamed protein product [Leishmania braziliensis]CAM38087.2 conserved hypothetical protein [Leishmania braziliensis MHOM/BR/75/M2904]